MLVTNRICPNCRNTFALITCEVYDTGPQETETGMIRCAKCSERRHWTHWKTPKEHDEREMRVNAMCDNIRADA